jgi:hypothetical protein
MDGVLADGKILEGLEEVGRCAKEGPGGDDVTVIKVLSSEVAVEDLEFLGGSLSGLSPLSFFPVAPPPSAR